MLQRSVGQYTLASPRRRKAVLLELNAATATTGYVIES